MSCVSSSLKAAKNVWDQVSPELSDVIVLITTWTGRVHTLELNPAVQAIVAVIPQGGAVEGFINTAIDDISGVANAVKPIAEKLSEWLSKATTKYDQESKLVKIAAVAAKVADVSMGAAAKANHVYDSAVQMRIIADIHTPPAAVAPAA